MAGRARKIPKDIQDVFDKYIHNNVRHLDKEASMKMLEAEFGLTEEQASTMFDSFDKDQNGVMSLWEFQQLYTCVGNSAGEMIKKFQELDTDGSGKLDLEEATAGLKDVKMGDRPLEDKEIEFFLKASKGEDEQIDLGAFTTLLYTLKMYEKKQAGKPKPKK